MFVVFYSAYKFNAGTVYRGAWGSVVVKVSRTVPGLIHGGVTGFFSIPSDHIMALGWIQPLVKMSTRNIYWG